MRTSWGLQQTLESWIRCLEAWRGILASGDSEGPWSTIAQPCCLVLSNDGENTPPSSKNLLTTYKASSVISFCSCSSEAISRDLHTVLRRLLRGWRPAPTSAFFLFPVPGVWDLAACYRRGTHDKHTILL